MGLRKRNRKGTACSDSAERSLTVAALKAHRSRDRNARERRYPAPWLGTGIGAAHGAKPRTFIRRVKTCFPSVT